MEYELPPRLLMQMKNCNKETKMKNDKKIKNLRVSDGNVTGLVYWDVSNDEEFYWDLP